MAESIVNFEARIGSWVKKTTSKLPPFFQTNLGQRVFTALIGVPLILTLITWGGRLGAATFVLVISLGMVKEYSALVFKLSDRLEKTSLMVAFTWALSLANFLMSREEYGLFVAAVFGLAFYFLVTVGRHQGPDYEVHFKEGVFSVFGMFYFVFLPFFFVLVRDGGLGGKWAVLFLLLVWGTDTGAYFAGLKYGKKKLFPLVSPKKTWEGAYGGLGAVIVLTALYKLIIFKELAWSGVLIIPVLVSAFSQVGDLCESFLKRSFQCKDTGNILPGHGGFLDRFDGFLFSLPIMYACVRIWS